MPHHHHHHYHGGYYRRSSGNPICSLIYCAVLIGIFLVIIWNTTGFYTFGYFTPFIGIIIFVVISGIIAAIVNAARRKSRMQVQPTGSIASPTGYPPQGGYPPVGPVGTATPQQGGYNPVTFQAVPQPRPVGIQQPQVQPSAPVPAISSRFCTYCGTPVEGTDQRFCANCGAEL